MSYTCALHNIEVSSEYQLCPLCWKEARISVFPEYQSYIRGIFENREKIIAAFMAEYGLLPHEVEQVEEYKSDGIRWYVRKRA